MTESDAEPGLTPEGRAKVQDVAARMSAENNEKPEILFCSPLLRAQETAEIFNAFWGLKSHGSDLLLPHVGPAQVLEMLRGFQAKKIALVGHMPNLGLLLATLIWGLPPQEAVMPRGAAALLQVEAWEPGAAKLLNFIET